MAQALRGGLDNFETLERRGPYGRVEANILRERYLSDKDNRCEIWCHKGMARVKYVDLTESLIDSSDVRLCEFIYGVESVFALLYKRQ